MKQATKQTRLQLTPSAPLALKDEQAKKPVLLELDEAKAILTEMLLSGGVYDALDMSSMIQTLAGLDRKMAHVWAAELMAHIEKVDAEDDAECAKMRAALEKAEADLETAPDTSATDIGAAYKKLAEGVCAVLSLESTEPYLHELLTRTVSEIWNTSANKDAAGAARWQLLHAGEWKARHVEKD